VPLASHLVADVRPVRFIALSSTRLHLGPTSRSLDFCAFEEKNGRDGEGEREQGGARTVRGGHICTRSVQRERQLCDCAVTRVREESRVRLGYSPQYQTRVFPASRRAFGGEEFCIFVFFLIVCHFTPWIRYRMD